jgi:hypothetical protein
MRTQKRLEKVSTAISLLAFEDAASTAGGILGIFLGATFLIVAFLHWKRNDQIQGEFLAEEAPLVEIAY